jgi:hypothetical protein
MSDRGKGAGGLTEQEQAIRRGVLNYLESAKFDRVHERFDTYWRPSTTSGPLTAFRSLLSAITMPFASQQNARDDEARKERKQEILRRASRSIPVLLYPVWIDSGLARTSEDVWPAIYAGTIEPAARNSPDVMHRLISRVAKTESQKIDSDGHPDYQPHKRRRVSAETTEGIEIYVFHVLLARDFVPDGEFRPAPLPFLVEPEEGGQILAVPTQVVAESLRSR